MILPQIGKTFEMEEGGQPLLEGRHFGNRLGQEVVVLQGRERQVEPRHPSHLLRPETCGIDHVLGGDRALLGDEVPEPVRPLLQLEDAVVLDDGGAALFRGAGIGPDRARGVDETLAISPQAAEYPPGAADRPEPLDRAGADAASISDSDVLYDAL